MRPTFSRLAWRAGSVGVHPRRSKVASEWLGRNMRQRNLPAQFVSMRFIVRARGACRPESAAESAIHKLLGMGRDGDGANELAEMSKVVTWTPSRRGRAKSALVGFGRLPGDSQVPVPYESLCHRGVRG